MRASPFATDASLRQSSAQAHLDALKRGFHEALAQGDLPQAQYLIETAIRHAPGAAAVKALHATVLTRQGRHAEAAGQLEAAFRIEPAMIEYLAYAAASWDRAGRREETRNLTIRLLALEPFQPIGLALAARTALLAGKGPMGCVWADGSGIAGWAWDPRRAADRLPVTVRLGGMALTARADRMEPRLASAGIGDGGHAFFIDLAPFAAPGSAVIDADVEGAPLIASARSQPKPDRGCVLGAVWFDGRGIRGWAVDTDRPQSRLTVTLRSGTRWHHTVQADELDQGLLAQGVGDGHHGFTVCLPPFLEDGTAEIAVFVEGHAALAGSPVLIAGDLRRSAVMRELSGWLRAAGQVEEGGTPPPLPQALAGPAALAICRETIARLTLQSQALPGPGALSGSVLPSAAGLLPNRSARLPGVAVVVPVFGGLKETSACLDALLASRSRNATRFDIVAVDDASPLPELGRRLDELARSGEIRLIRHRVNQGFASSVNAGMKVWPDRDIVLLNSDTLVYGDWVDRLRRTCHTAPDIGTVTPLSNNGSICSYPRPNAVNPMPPAAELERLDRLCAKVNAGTAVEIPTGVGFCLYIRRECGTETGALDAAAFPRGYGEENDFCRRAETLGWRHVVAGDVFVAHHGSISFDTEKTSLLAAGMNVLDGRYPGYRNAVDRFVRFDPLRPLRRNLDLQHAVAVYRRAVLFITTDQEGGTERHVAERVRELEGTGQVPVILRPAEGGQSPGGGRLVRLAVPPLPDLCNLVFDLPAEADVLLDVLTRFGFSRIEVHHMLNLPAEVLDIVHRLDLPYDVTVHDYAWFCPRITMIDHTGSYCGEPALAACERCVALNGSETGEAISVTDLRQRSQRLFRGAREVVAPSADSAARIRRHVQGARIVTRPHRDHDAPAGIGGCAWDGTRPLRAVLVGAIGEHKGFRILRDCVRDAAKRDLPLEFSVVGRTFDDDALRAAGRISITGPYAPHEAADLIRASRSDVALFLSVWPETWCYALTEAWAAGLPAFGFDIGAIGERIAATGLGAVFPLGWQACEINDFLLETARRMRGPSAFCRK
ncbi:GT2 family glycosyltransferase/glycosyltransferase involved in cell wall biosynthesis [Skermanella aerolata]|uniref:glycosyltransferase n=1 Tax=Skermanella aerolata TaxID=393310 RepID=UPI003D197D5B